MPLAEYNDVTRMSRAQLADRIRQMEATAARNSQIGAPNERHRPGEDRHRREKIALYQAELDRRTQYDAAQAAADAREEERRQQQSQRDTRRNMRRLGIDPDWRPQDETSRPAPQPPAPIGQQLTPDAGNKEPMTYNAAIEHTMREEKREYLSAAEDRRQEHRTAERGRLQEINYQPAAERPVKLVPPLTVECPQCHAAPGQRCTNYKGNACSYHHERNAAARTAPRPQPTPEAAPPEPPPSHPDPAAAHSPAARAAKRASKEAAAKAEATIRAVRGETDAELAELRATIRALVERHTCGTVIEAAWDAARAIHGPR